MKFVVREKYVDSEYCYYTGDSYPNTWNKFAKSKRFDSADEARKEIKSAMGEDWPWYEVIEVPDGKE